MKQSRNRSEVDGYCIQVLIINGDIQQHLSHKCFPIENISKGGFRFITDVSFELEDRMQVVLHFPDGRAQEVLGRICYNDQQDDGTVAYGFSVIEGFYSLKTIAA